MAGNPGLVRRQVLQWALRLAGLLVASTTSAAEPAAAPAASAAMAPGAAATPVPIETFFRRPDIATVTLSPSGNWLAVKAGNQVGRYAVVVLDVNGKVPPQVVANFNDIDVGQVQWVNDERLILDVVDLERGSGDDRHAPGLFSVRRDGSEFRQLVQVRSGFVSESTGPRTRLLDVTHVLLHIPSGGAAGDEVIVGEYERSGHTFSGALIPKRLNVATGRASPLDRGLPRQVHQWLFDSSGAPRVAVVTDKGRDTVHWRANANSTSREDWVVLASAPRLELPWWPRFVDAKGQLFVTVPAGPAGEQELRRFDFASGRPETQAFVRTPGFDFIGSLIADAASGTLLGVRAITDGEISVWLDPRLKLLQAEVDRRLPGRVNRLSCGQCMGADSTVLVKSWSDQAPGEYWLWRGEPGAPQLWKRVGEQRKDVDPARMATLDMQRFAARDGLQIPVWVTTPPGAQPGQKLPAVVMPHGGPWVRGGDWEWHSMAQFLASRGYVVIEPEFRGSTGFGAKHFQAGWKQWGRAMQDDVSDAVRWAAAKGLIDGSRVCIAGASYGGYAALMGLVRDPGQYRCGIAWLAVSEPTLLLQGGWFSSVSDAARDYGLLQLLGNPDDDNDARMLRQVSPVQQAAQIKVPVLLAYGELDERVPLEHGKRMRAALRAAGQEPQWVVYEGEGHGWRVPANRVDFARRVERFLAENLRSP